MTPNFQDVCISLAAVVQAAKLVQQVAHEGRHPQDAFQTSINSIFSLNPGSIRDIYGHHSQIELGLQHLKTILTQKQHDLADVLKYTASILHLEKRLNKSPSIQAKLKQRIETASQQSEVFSTTHSNVIANLADTYRETISDLGPKIMVSGEPSFLQNPEIANKIRALLLAGIRSAVLWRQLGGSRWQLFFGKRKILNALESL